MGYSRQVGPSVSVTVRGRAAPVRGMTDQCGCHSIPRQRQTRREAGTQSHGSNASLETLWIARLPTGLVHPGITRPWDLGPDVARQWGHRRGASPDRVSAHRAGAAHFRAAGFDRSIARRNPLACEQFRDTAGSPTTWRAALSSAALAPISSADARRVSRPNGPSPVPFSGLYEKVSFHAEAGAALRR